MKPWNEPGKCVNCIQATYFGELRTDVGLLQTRPEREWNEQELVGILEMLECRSQMMNRIFQCVFNRA